jgi:hypothetical protein
MGDFELSARRLLFNDANIRRFTANVVMARDKVGNTVPIHGCAGRRGSLEKPPFARHSCEGRNPVPLLFKKLRQMGPRLRRDDELGYQVVRIALVGE